ncbi:hypothetical protein GW846_00800 [Candidatus Gracilibacteria bacterium]|nr:hypothetical protein [Candidatus Gracilibacteria bacterium]
MKSLLAIVLLSLVSFSYTFAGEEAITGENKSKSMEDREVIMYDFDLEVEIENGKAVATWDDFPANKGFEWYKLVYSTSNTNPVYPHDKTVFIGERLQLTNTFKLDSSSNNHYVRLCAVILNDDYSKDRYCGETQHLITSESDFHTEEINKDHSKKVEVKKTETKTEAKKEIKKEYKSENKSDTKMKVSSNLNTALKTRINVLLENFIDRLEARGDSDEKIAATIDLVIERLEKLSGNVTYNKIVDYMILALTELKEEYSNSLGDIESVFDGF